MKCSHNHNNPAFHAALYSHYASLIEDAPTEQIKQFLLDKQQHHAHKYTELMEVHDMANEFQMPVEDLIKLSSLVKRYNLDQITLDHDEHRIVVRDTTTQCVVAWFRTKTKSHHTINR